jgi:hypothetical protein
MKVKLLKIHLDFKKDEVIEVKEERAHYLIQTNVAVKHEKKQNSYGKRNF